MKVYLGSDHGGFEIRQKAATFLKEVGFEIEVLGSDVIDPNDDYPLAAKAVAEKVISDSQSVGILWCRSGQGVCVVANKFPGIRAALAWNEKSARASRTDDNVNVLCLPADYLSEDKQLTIAKAWLETDYQPEERYKRRLQEITQIEQTLKGM